MHFQSGGNFVSQIFATMKFLNQMIHFSHSFHPFYFNADLGERKFAISKSQDTLKQPPQKVKTYFNIIRLTQGSE